MQKHPRLILHNFLTLDQCKVDHHHHLLSPLEYVHMFCIIGYIADDVHSVPGVWSTVRLINRSWSSYTRATALWVTVPTSSPPRSRISLPPTALTSSCLLSPSVVSGKKEKKKKKIKNGDPNSCIYVHLGGFMNITFMLGLKPSI